MSFAFLAIIAFLILQAFIGIYFGRTKSANTEENYLLGGRSLGLTLTSLTLFATFFGAESTLGTATSINLFGLSGGRIDPFGYTFAMMLMGFFFAYPLRKRNLYNLSELFAQSFGHKAEQLSVFILIPATLIWVSAQIKAFGHIMAEISPLSVPVGMIIGLCFLLAYTFKGGFLGSVWTDVVQSLFVIIGLVLLLVLTFKAIPLGMSEIFSSIFVDNKEKLALWRPSESFFENINGWSIPILGSLVSHEMISRFLAAKDSLIAKKSTLYASLLYIIIGLIPVTIGLLIPLLGQYHLVSSTGDDGLLISLSKNVMPPMLHVLFYAAIISAILSTADSSLLTISGLITHNTLRFIFPEEHSQKKLVRWNQLSLVICAVLVFFMGLFQDRITRLLEIASSFGTSGVLIVTIIALYFPKWNHSVAAFWTLLLGLVSQLLLEFVFELEGAFLMNIFSGIIIYFAVRKLTKNKVMAEAVEIE